ncbi:MAG TPA: hypothetical protein VFG47_05300 [Geminicoccaceae bacterium]|nr:hypothetical protein [Geminicoccaceae bacterium]
MHLGFLPTRLQEEVLRTYSQPNLVCFEIFNLQSRRLQDENTDFIVWAALADPDELENYHSRGYEQTEQTHRKEAGIYTSFAATRQLHMKDPLVKILSSSNVPKEVATSSDDTVERVLEFVKDATPPGLAEDQSSFEW